MTDRSRDCQGTTSINSQSDSSLSLRTRGREIASPKGDHTPLRVVPTHPIEMKTDRPAVRRLAMARRQTIVVVAQIPFQYIRGFGVLSA
jgi:hypothetical protein